MAPKSTNMASGTINNCAFWPKGGGKGYPKINKNMKKYINNSNVKNPYNKKHVFQIWGDFLKNRRAQRRDVYYGIMINGRMNVK